MNTKLFNRDYILLIQGSLFSSFGYVLYSAAISYWVYQQTGSTVLMGVLSGITMFVRMFLLPFGGTVSDHASRRNIIAAADAICGIAFTAVGILALTGHLGVGIIAFAAVISGVCGSFLHPAAVSLLVDVIPKDEFIRGHSIYDGGNALLQLAGQAISGIFIVTFGAPLLILINGICYFISSATELFIRDYPGHSDAGSLDLTGLFKSFFACGRDFLGRRALFVFSIVLIILNVLCTGAYNLLIAYTSAVGMTTQQYGYLGAAISCGGLLGMAVVGTFKIKKERRFGIMVVSYAVMGVCCGLGFLVADFVPTCLLFIVAFAFNAVGNGILLSCITMMMPEEKRGGMMGFIQAACIGGDALSGVLYGIVSDIIPIRIASGLGQILTVIPLILIAFDKGLKRALEES